MKKEKQLKTITLVDNTENPLYSIAYGHIGPREFNKRFKAEGWKGGGRVLKSDLTHEYWIKLKHSWKKSTKENKRAIQVTVNCW